MKKKRCKWCRMIMTDDVTAEPGGGVGVCASCANGEELQHTHPDQADNTEYYARRGLTTRIVYMGRVFLPERDVQALYESPTRLTEEQEADTARSSDSAMPDSRRRNTLPC